MVTKKILRLVNNERTSSKLESRKACDATATDYCYYEDSADCKTYAYDQCTKDYAACFQGADDYCGVTYDLRACYGPGVTDNQ